MLPASLRSYAKLVKDVVVIGVSTRSRAVGERNLGRVPERRGELV